MMVRAEVALVCMQKGVDAGIIDSSISTFVVIMILISSLIAPIILKSLNYTKQATTKSNMNDGLESKN